ncbi:MAG: hypothetical protein J0H16_19170, partial [Alicycliphilus denitrificans]|nr:hypothetical protein [Alicycliphilus denitrificans]
QFSGGASNRKRHVAAVQTATLSPFRWARSKTFRYGGSNPWRMSDALEQILFSKLPALSL